ncbi:MAG: hypothetical protein OXI91_07680 [Chloroflexota bacterium]|nr:hypothetical protein [Chloroflexota bacterium]
MATANQNPRYEAHENPPLLTTIGYGFQFSLIASAALLVTPVIVARVSGMDESYLIWMVFASLVVVGISTLIQVKRIGPVGSGALLPMYTAAFAIPFCITAVSDGGPGTLMALVVVSAITQLAISKWLFILRKIITPTVGGTVMMILSITLASVVFHLLEETSKAEPIKGPAVALITLVVVAGLTLRGSAILRLWGPVVGIVVGCLASVALGVYDFGLVTRAPWVGLPREIPAFDLNMGIPFWTLLPSFLFLGVIISIQSNGEAIAQQRAAQRENQAVDFRRIQGALAGGGVTNLLAGLFGAVPNSIHPGSSAFAQTTGVASRRVGYVIGIIFVVVAFLPKVSGLLSTIPGAVMTGYLILVSGILLVDGARLIIQTESNRQKIVVAGVCFWLAAAFQFGLFTSPDLGALVNALLKSGITTGGLAAIIMVLYLEFTNPRSRRFESRLHVDSLPDLNEFVAKFADSRGWDDSMKARLSAVAEETLLTLAPLNLDGDEEETDGDRRLIVLASSEGTMADLEFIGSGNESNIEDKVRQLQQHDTVEPTEHDISLLLLRNFASSVRHQQYHDTDIITVRVVPPTAS